MPSWAQTWTLDLGRTRASFSARRDEQLKGPDFLDVEKYPVMAFKSKRVEAPINRMSRVIGDLTIKTVTREVGLAVEVPTSPVTDRGTMIVGTTATTRINRKDFGMTWNRAIESGGVLVGDEITIALDVQMRRLAR